MQENELSPYRIFSAVEWGKLREGAEMTLTEGELENLRGLGETISLAEAEEIYLPLSRLLSLYVEATQTLYGATNEFLGREIKVPFIIGVAGSVAEFASASRVPVLNGGDGSKPAPAPAPSS